MEGILWDQVRSAFLNPSLHHNHYYCLQVIQRRFSAQSQTEALSQLADEDIPLLLTVEEARSRLAETVFL